MMFRKNKKGITLFEVVLSLALMAGFVVFILQCTNQAIDRWTRIMNIWDHKKSSMFATEKLMLFLQSADPGSILYEENDLRFSIDSDMHRFYVKKNRSGLYYSSLGSDVLFLNNCTKIKWDFYSESMGELCLTCHTKGCKNYDVFQQIKMLVD